MEQEHVHAETETRLCSETHAWFTVPHSLWCSPQRVWSKCQMQFLFRTNAPTGCVPSPPGFFWSEDCSRRLCGWISPHGGGCISALAGNTSWDSVLERIFQGPPRRGSRFSQCRWSRYYINSQGFILTSRAPAFFTDTCNVPEVMWSFLSLQSASLASNRSVSLKAKFQCIRDSWVDVNATDKPRDACPNPVLAREIAL